VAGKKTSTGKKAQKPKKPKKLGASIPLKRPYAP